MSRKKITTKPIRPVPMFTAIFVENDDYPEIRVEPVDSVAALETKLDELFQDWCEWTGDDGEDAFSTFQNHVVIICGEPVRVEFEMLPASIRVMV